MSVFTSFLHHLSFRLTQKGKREFLQSAKQLQAAQEHRFRQIMQTVSGSDSGYRNGLTSATGLTEFRQRIAISDYEDWQDLIARQRSSGGPVLSSDLCERYQPTSGSTSRIKWIPYTPSFLQELDQAITPWMADLYQRFPGIRRGRHYWSLSWVPQELRSVAGSVNDDLQLLPWWKRLFMSGTMAVPQQVSLAPTSELSLFATLCYLCACRDLTLMSVWSPTFTLSLLQQLSDKRREVAAVLDSGRWAGDWGTEYEALNYLPAPKQKAAAAILRQWNGQLNADITRQLWPQLALISAWDTSTSAPWAQQLQQLFRHAQFQGKGLWATEGVVTFPFEGACTLALNSHFYEFENLDSGELLFSWELTPGMRVCPVISSANGLLRYRTKDQLVVEGFIHQCPTLRFISRLSGTDMVGEKMAPETALDILQQLAVEYPVQPVSLLAVPGGRHDKESGCYALLADGDASLTEEIAQRLEVKLSEHFHYQLARELGQLAPAQAILSKDAVGLYTRLRTEAGAVAGNIKIEPLLLCPQAGPLLPESEECTTARSAQTVSPIETAAAVEQTGVSA
ncbi:GH3 family domain-containing protein [Thalassolituus sp. LLYu03]|uniref:GH3 family domain-containing protein n=1 Tax=Thalassolituus sp. LLYu03 TaxID=3421656 RepID=UPI003D2C9D4C